MRRPLLLALAFLALAPVMFALGSDPQARPGLSAEAELEGELERALEDAAGVYAFNCAVCHGATGGGLAEAKLAFPADHRNCTRCHKQGNPVVMPLNQPIMDNNMFPIGDPPALHALGVDEPTKPAGEAGTAPARAPLAAVAAPEALHAYIKATMPRYHPGKLSDAEYWLISAHLLSLNGRGEEAAAALSTAVQAGWSPSLH